MYKYIGESKVAFENGRIYKAEKDHDEFGDFYHVLDESGEWYRYDADFFEQNFVPVDKSFMYDYTVYPEDDERQFNIACDKIKEFMPSYVDKGTLMGWDSCIQVFSDGINEIMVYNDSLVGAIYVKSDIELPFLKDKKIEMH